MITIRICRGTFLYTESIIRHFSESFITYDSIELIISCQPNKNILKMKVKIFDMLGKIIVTPMKALPYKLYLNMKLKRNC